MLSLPPPSCQQPAQQWSVPRPSSSDAALFSNVNRDSSMFLQGAGIEMQSQQHKQLKKTIQVLHRRHLHPFKYVEEQIPSCVDQLIAKVQLSLPWLNKFEDAWPARIYLKRYLDTKRPHLMISRHGLQKQKIKWRTQVSQKAPTTDPAPVPPDQDPVIGGFLGSLLPSLKHRRDAFAKLGINNKESLAGFLSWPQVVQSQFVDENHHILQLTSLEKKALLLGCGLLLQKSLHQSAVKVLEAGRFV